MTGRKQRKSSTSCSSQQLNPPTNCLSRCQFEPHANLVMRCAATGNLDLFKHSISICSNPWNIRDAIGRNVLLVAASCGHLDIVLYLLKKKERVKIDSTDFESRWSALHRAAYFGQVGILVPLFKNGGNLEQLDFDKFSPLNILHYNMDTVNRNELSYSSCLYVWGTNSNMTLGHDHVRTSPEVLDLPIQYGNIKQAVICKFHSVFLSEKGAVYTCGHGHGGRLGHGNDKTCLAPKLVQALTNETCTAIAAARDHTVFLTNSGVVYTCGLNDAHQLGQTPKNPGPILPVSLAPFYLRLLRGLSIIAIGAGRYHTAVCTEREVYTFGKNLGQLGYANSTETQIQPEIVTGIHIDRNDSISHFSVSDAATACLTKKRLIYVCAKYTVLRCERLAVPKILSIVHFMICASLGELQNKQQKKKGHQSSGGTSPSDTASDSGLTLGLTDSRNQLWLSHWTDFTKRSCTSPQLIPGSTKRNVLHFAITKNLTIVTPQGEVFTRPLSLPLLPSLLSLKRVSNIQQVQKVFTDYKTNNMAVIQKLYNPPVLPKPELSTFTNDVYNLLTEESLPGSVYDVTFDVIGTRLPANKLILSSHSTVFSSLFTSTNSTLPKLISPYDTHQSLIYLTFNEPRLFELFLQYLYGGHLTIRPVQEQPVTNNTNKIYHDTKNYFDVLRDTNFDKDYVIFDKQLLSPKTQNQSPPGVNSNNGAIVSIDVCYETNTIRDDLYLLMSLAVNFKVDDLIKRIDSALSSHSKSRSYSPSKSRSPTKPHSCTIKGPPILLNPKSVSHDTVIVSETGTSHFCHKCILVTRSDYFQSMLLMGWKETPPPFYQLVWGSLRLAPIMTVISNLMSNLTDFMYTPDGREGLLLILSTTSNESITTLNLPMSDSLIEMVIDYLYTDQVTTVQESSSLEWLTMALTTADQLLLKRLKTICELSLAKILTLDNIGYIIHLSEVYNAEQLQDSCVRFVCLNIPALLEMGGLEGVSIPILDKISKMYREMFPKVTKRKGLNLKELSADEVPSGYLSNEIIESTDDESEDTMSSWKHSISTTPIARTKSPLDTPTSASKTTPTSSSARKKRRKRGSGTKETPRQLFSPVASPEPTLPKCESDELDCLDKIITDFVLQESTKDNNDNNNEQRDIDHKMADIGKTEIPLTECQTSCSMGTVNSNRGTVNSNRGTLHGGTEETGLGYDEGMNDGLDRWGTAVGTRSLRPWGNRKNSSSEDVTNFKEIMKTEEIHRKKEERENVKVKKKHKRSQPIQMATTNNSTPGPVTEEIGIVRSMSLPMQTGRSPIRPWGFDPSNQSSTVSLKTLMAEEEAETQVKHKVDAVPIMSIPRPVIVEEKPHTVPKRERHTSFPPLISSGPVVSFTDIVTNQQNELDQHLHNQSHRKQLQSIQIEEQAIQGLLSLYNATNNPNEYITIERVVPMGVVKSLPVPTNKRTSAPYTGTRSAWDKKNKF